MDIDIIPTKKVLIFGIDKRSMDNLVWCASTYGINRLFWIEGYLLCLEVYEKSFEHEIKNREFPISQVCYTKFPKYTKTYEVERGVKLPIVNATDTTLFRNLLKEILKIEEKSSKQNEKDKKTNKSENRTTYSF